MKTNNIKSNPYNPSPEDTSSIILPKKLIDLGEKIARNVHDVWAQGRLREGWTYGESKDLDKKQLHYLFHTKNFLRDNRDG